MPLYEYVCSSCGQRFEKMMRFSEVDHLPECPQCHSAETRKQISMFASASAGGGGYAASTSSCGTSHGGFG